MVASAMWTAQVAEDFDLDGWLYIPRDLDAEGRREWVAAGLDHLSPLIGVERWDGSATTRDHLRELLESGIDREAEMESLATFLVWPIPGPAALICRVTVVPSDMVRGVLSGEPAGAAHRVEAAHIGPGVQFSTRTQVETEEGAVDFYSVDLMFDDGAAAVVISLEQSLAALISNSFSGLAILKDLLQIERPDGSRFTSTPPATVPDDQPWELTTP